LYVYNNPLIFIDPYGYLVYNNFSYEFNWASITFKFDMLDNRYKLDGTKCIGGYVNVVKRSYDVIYRVEYSLGFKDLYDFCTSKGIWNKVWSAIKFNTKMPISVVKPIVDFVKANLGLIFGIGGTESGLSDQNIYPPIYIPTNDPCCY